MANFVVIFRANFATNWWILRWRDRHFYCYSFKQRSSFALSTTMCSRNEPIAKPLTSWLVPSFSQHNLCLLVSGHCLHISVTKFQGKFVSLRQANSPNSRDKFQICCTDMYLIRCLLNFAVFWVFLWISWLHNRAKYQKLRHIAVHM